MERIIIRMLFDKQINKKYYRFHLFRKSFTFYLILLTGLFVVYLAVKNTFMATDTEEVQSLSSMIMIWSLAFFALVLAPSFMIWRINSLVKKEAKKRGDKEEYISITKEKIERRIDGQDKLVFGWNNIVDIRELDDMFLLYVDTESAIVVSKHHMIEGSPEVLRSLIEKYGPKDKKGKLKYKVHMKGYKKAKKVKKEKNDK